MAWSWSERLFKCPRKPSTGCAGGHDRNEDADLSEGDGLAQFPRFGAVGGGEAGRLLDPNLRRASEAAPRLTLGAASAQEVL